MTLRALPCLLVLTVVAPGCPADVAGFPNGGGEPTDPDQVGGRGNGGGDDDDDDDDSDRTIDPYWCCDPDEPTCRCEGYWVCTEGFEGKTCRQNNPLLPDEGAAGDWACEYEGETIVCVGDAGDHPDAGQDGGWNCHDSDDGATVICSRDATDDDFPESGGPWDCTFSEGGDVRACHPRDEGGPGDGEWDCWTAADGSTTCVDRTPRRPDGGDWDCERVDGRDVCQGDGFPEDGEASDWDCTQVAELVRCEDDEGQTPDDGDAVDWNCLWEDATVVCVHPPDGGGETGTGSGGGGDGLGPCDCIEGANRICDEPVYCLFGEQTCVVQDGVTRWGHCAEAGIPAGCEPGGGAAADFDWEYGGGFWDTAEVRATDVDGDGVLLSIPDWWFNPAGEDCAIRQGRCVQDMWDIDGDGDNTESMGECADVDACF